MIRQSATNLTVFIFDLFIDEELKDRLIRWMLVKQPQHMIRTLVNAERAESGGMFELVFSEEVDAMEFKLIFL